ncbi:hypothetical protein [Shewanella phage FishSpeaker]|nr:hypothetical protein [Shewanella phage FishSpeaker]
MKHSNDKSNVDETSKTNNVNELTAAIRHGFTIEIHRD